MVHSRAVVLASIALTACSSSSKSTATNADAGADGGGATTLTVLALEIADDAAKPTTADATIVAVDATGGEHEEVTTGPDGLAKFTIDVSKGPFAVTGWRSGRTMYSVADVTKESLSKLPKAPGFATTDAQVYLFPPSDIAHVTGMITNKASATNPVVLTSTRSASGFEGPGAQFDVAIKKGAAHTLVAREYTAGTAPSQREANFTTVKWAKVDLPAPDAAKQTATVDMAAAPLTSTTVHGKITIPGGDSGPLGGTTRPLVIVSSVESGGGVFLGGITTMTLAADKNSFDWGVDYVNVAGQTPLTIFLLIGQDGAVSRVGKIAAPTEGMNVDDFPPVPAITIQSQSLGDPVATEGAAADATIRVLVNSALGEPLWSIDAPPGTTAVHVPPVLAAAKSTFGRGLLGNILFLSGNDEATHIYTKVGGSRQFTVTLP